MAASTELAQSCVEIQTPPKTPLSFRARATDSIVRVDRIGRLYAGFAMSRLARLLMLVVFISTTTGCCISFYDRLQNGWVWDDPKPGRHRTGPKPPVATPARPHTTA